MISGAFEHSVLYVQEIYALENAVFCMYRKFMLWKMQCFTVQSIWGVQTIIRSTESPEINSTYMGNLCFVKCGVLHCRPKQTIYFHTYATQNVQMYLKSIVGLAGC